VTEKTDTDNPDHGRSVGLMDIIAVADRLGVSVRHVRRLVNERRIPYIKWGHLLRFDPADVEQWLDAKRRTVAPPPLLPSPARRRPAQAEPLKRSTQQLGHRPWPPT
jgi:excisionase family DNA binding protein